MANSDIIFLDLIKQGISKEQAFLMAYGVNSPKKAQELINEPSIKEALAKQGITLRKLNNHLKKQLVAKKAIAVSKDSYIEYVPDNQAIDQALTKGYKLLGVYNDNSNTIIDNRSITFNGNISQLASVVAEMKELRKQASIEITGEVLP